MYVIVGVPDKGDVLGPATGMLAAIVRSPFVSQRIAPFVARHDRSDLLVLADLVMSGTLVPVVDRTYPLADTADALRYIGSGHARGKTVITM